MISTTSSNCQAQHAVSLRSAARALVLAMACGSLLGAAAEPAAAQSWWPFGGYNDDEPRRPPVPQEPVYRPDAPPPPAPGEQPSPQAQPQPQTNWSTKNPICLQLEQRLVSEGQKGSSARDQLPRIESEIRQFDKTYNVSQSQLDRGCYETFLFTRSFRGTPQCKDLMRQSEGAKRRLAELEAQRQDIMASGGRSYKDDIIRELARNNCGANYVDQARRRDGGIWEDEEAAVGGNTWTQQGANGATYRTLCVRLCDGYYFPVSFSTLPSHFPQDADVCSSKCAAPSELYYYPNPGGAVGQSVALKSQTPYTDLKAAFRYRKEYVNGCSCKEAEYDAEKVGGEKRADAGAATGAKKPATSASEVQRGDNGPRSAPLTTGATSSPDVESGWQPQ